VLHSFETQKRLETFIFTKIRQVTYVVSDVCNYIYFVTNKCHFNICYVF
jgi:hypothetical protein